MSKLDPQELYLPRLKPHWDTLEDLIEALGCVLVESPRMMRTDEDWEDCVGDPPMAEAILKKGGKIYVDSFDTMSIAYATHEALHWRLGPKSMQNEFGMMTIELELVRRIECDVQRLRYLEFFGGYLLTQTHTVDNVVAQHRARWRSCKAWKAEVASAKRKFPFHGRLPEAHRWRCS